MLTVTDLVRAFGPQPVIDRLNLHVAPGERVCLMAPCGAGKSTLVRIVCGLDPEFTGQMALGARRPAALFQQPGLFWYRTVDQNIGYPLRLARRPMDAQARLRLAAWTEVCGLTGWRTRYPHELSGGMRQMVALARTFIAAPDFAVLDEPFKSIDRETKRRIIDLICRNHPGITLLIMTHDRDEVPAIASRVVTFAGPHLSDRHSSG